MYNQLLISICFLILPIVSFGETTLLGNIASYPIVSGTHMGAYHPSLNSSGRYLAFSTNYQLTPDYTPKPLRYELNLYLYDRIDKVYEHISARLDPKLEQGGICTSPIISENGRYVAFLSTCQNLVEGDTTSDMDPPIGSWPSIFTFGDCFVRDRIERKTIRVNISSEGKEATHGCDEIDMSHDGRYIVFSSIAPNLVANDTNDALDIFVHDVQTHTTRLISKVVKELPNDSFNCSPSISMDGRFIAYHTYKDYGHDYVMNYIGQIIVYDMLTDTREIITKGWDGSLGNGYVSASLKISNDGRFVAFISTANNLLPNLPQSWGYVYLYDRLKKLMKMIVPLEKPPTGGMGWSEGFIAGGYKLIFSGDGRYVFWYESEINCFKLEIFRYDRITGKIDTLLSLPAPRKNEIFPGASQESACNYDGSVLAFTTDAYDLIATQETLMRYFLFVMEIPILSNASGWSLFR